MDRSNDMRGEPGGRRGSAGEEPGGSEREVSEPGTPESRESRESESTGSLEGESEDSPREERSGMREIMERVNNALREQPGASPDR